MANSSTERVRAHRERRRAALEADPDAPNLRDADELIAPAVAETLAALGLADEHTAAAKLAERYAATIDDAKDQAWAARWIGPLLLDALESLGATPLARARMTKGTKAPAGTSGWLQQLRETRQQTFPGA